MDMGGRSLPVALGGNVGGRHVWFQLGEGCCTSAGGILGWFLGQVMCMTDGCAHPQGDGKAFRGIGLAEVLWKAATRINNRNMNMAITYHDILHRFWLGQGAGTAILKAKLIHQLAATR